MGGKQQTGKKTFFFTHTQHTRVKDLQTWRGVGVGLGVVVVGVVPSPEQMH